MSKVKWLISGGVSFFVTLVFTALAFYATRHVLLGRIALVMAWIVGVILITTGITPIKKFAMKILAIVLLTLACWGSDWKASNYKQTRSNGKNASSPSQSNEVNGNENATGNINQNGSGNNAVIGNGNSVGNTTYNAQNSNMSGWLHPGSDPVPDLAAGCLKQLRSDHGVVFIFGGSAVATDDFPLNVLMVADEPKLIVDRDPKYGGLAVSLDIFGADGKIIATIDHNKFTVNRNNYFTMKSGASSLSVVDQYKKEVLNIRYSNRKVIKLNAVLYYPGVNGPIEINENELIVETDMYSRNCSARLGKGVSLIAVRSSLAHGAVFAIHSLGH